MLQAVLSRLSAGCYSCMVRVLHGLVSHSTRTYAHRDSHTRQHTRQGVAIHVFSRKRIAE